MESDVIDRSRKTCVNRTKKKRLKVKIGRLRTKVQEATKLRQTHLNIF